MDDMVIIKEEPLDEYSSGTIFNYENGTIDHIKEENENIITVHATEALKIQNELSFFGQTLPGGNNILNQMKNCSSAGAVNAPPLKCRKNCGKLFGTLTERALHESHEHKNKTRTIKCNFCNQQFNSFFDLTRHMPEHRNVKRYICIDCSECFLSYEDLQNHRKKSHVSNIKSMEAAADDHGMDHGLHKVSVSEVKALKCDERNLTNSQSSTISSNPKLSPCGLTLLPRLPLQQQQPHLSFAEEIKAFAAKYQLKNNLVAKKRTSAVIINPIDIDKSKKSKYTKKERFEIIAQYAVPKAVGPLDSNNASLFLNTQIKQEPLDEQCDEHLAGDTIQPDFNDIRIKNEPLDDYIEVKNEPLDHAIDSIETAGGAFEDHIDQNIQNEDKKEILPTSNDVPLNDVCVVENNSHPIKTFKILKLYSAPQSTPTPINQINFGSTSKNIKILKLAPNVKIIKVPSIKLQSLNSSNLADTKAPFDETPPPPPTQSGAANTSTFFPIKLPYSQPITNNNAANIDQLKFKIQLPDENKANEAPPEDKNEITKLLEEAISSGQTAKRINVVPKDVLSFIESQPQKAKIIENIHRQIEIATKNSQTSTSGDDECSQECKNIEDKPDKPVKQEHSSDSCEREGGISLLPAPTSFFFSMKDTNFPELRRARCRYQNYRFSWICPKCPKLYERHQTFIDHLLTDHCMHREELENMIIEVRPSKVDKPSRKRRIHRTELSFVDLQKQNGTNGNTISLNQITQFRCPKCERHCSSKRMLMDHIAGDCSRIPLYKCPHCPKSFYSGQTLNCHRTIHTGELPHKCSFCDKRFRTRGQVTVHHRTHTGEKPFACQICSQRFTHRETLISHLSRHIGMKRYRCYGCSEHFSCISGLKAHRDLRPNTCAKVKLNTRAVGPRVRVVRGQVIFEPQPEINAYLRTEDPPEILSEIQNIQNAN